MVKKKLIIIWVVIILALAVLTRLAMGGPSGSKHILNMITEATNAMGYSNYYTTTVKATKGIPYAAPTVWKQVRSQFIGAYNKGEMSDGKEATYDISRLPLAGKSISDYLYNILMTHEKPVTEINEIVGDFFRDENDEIVFPQVHKAAKALTLLEEFLDKEDKRSLYTFFTEWMELLKDEQGNVTPGLESLYKFLDDNKACRNLATFRKKYDIFKASEMKKAGKNQSFVEELVVKLLKTNPEAPLEYYADKATALMTNTDGTVKSGLEEPYKIIVEHKCDKKLRPLWEKLVAYFKELSETKEGTQYTGKAKKLKEHFKTKYPKSEIPRTISQRIGGNIKEKRT